MTGRVQPLDPSSRQPLLLFYNQPFGVADPAEIIDCGGAAAMTSDRKLLPLATALIFHIPTLRGIDLPRKLPSQTWVAWSMESEVNYPELADRAFMRNFEITMTYRRDATVWCPYIQPEMAQTVIVAPKPKTESSPVVYFRSSQIDRCDRTSYAAELMKRVKIDSYGHVLRNKPLPMADTGRASLMEVMARYKFALTLENSIAEDYVSEKFFEALAAGAVPIYRGAPNIDMYAPGENCFINARDFSSLEELAAHLNRLDEDDEAYSQHHQWRRAGVRPQFQALLDRVREPPFRRLCHLLQRN